MSNFYQTRRYKKGLSGEKPSIISDKEGYDAQMRGYRQYLSNQNLADSIAARIRDGDSSSYSNSDSYSSSGESQKPATPEKRILWGAVALFLFWLDYHVAIYIATHPDPYPYPIEHPFTISLIPYFLFLFILVPGGIFFWPGLILIQESLGGRQ